MEWVYYLHEGKALVVWGLLLSISLCCSPLIITGLRKAKINWVRTDTVSYCFFAILLIIRGISYDASLAFVIGIFFLIISVLLLVAEKKNKIVYSKWSDIYISGLFILIGLIVRAIDILIVGVLYLIVIAVRYFVPRKTLSNVKLLFLLLLIVGGTFFFSAKWVLREPFIELASNKTVMKTRKATMKVGANPNTTLTVYQENKRCGSYTTNKSGRATVNFNQPGDYSIKVGKNNTVASKKVHVKSSKDYVQYINAKKLAENNKNGIKEKLKITSKNLQWNKDDYEYSVDITGKTSPYASVEIAEEDGEKTTANKNGDFTITYEYYSNDDTDTEIHVINHNRTKENNKKVQIKKNPDLDKQEASDSGKEDQSSSTETSNDGTREYKNASALKVGVEGYILDHHPAAEVEPFDYDIHKIAPGMYEVLGSYTEDGVNHKYDALVLDDGDKVEVQSVANIG